MKLGASATSPGVTARWRALSAEETALWAGRRVLGRVWSSRDGMRAMWIVWLDGQVTYQNRYQAKRAVEAAVSQALREAGQ